MQDYKPSSGNRDVIQTRPTVPNPAVCRGKLIAYPYAVQCLVDWPIYCIYVAKVGDCYFCGHKDRLRFAARAEVDGKRGSEKE